MTKNIHFGFITAGEATMPIRRPETKSFSQMFREGMQEQGLWDRYNEALEKNKPEEFKKGGQINN